MRIFSPSQLITFIDSPFASWYDRAAKEQPDKYKSLKDKEDKLQNVLQKKGYEHEHKILKEFKDKGLMISENLPQEEVKKAIEEGVDVIYQAKLKTARFSGDSDFIVKEDDGYIIYDTKLAREVKPYMIYQLCIYSEALGQIVGQLPKRFCVITGDGERVSFNTADFFYYFKSVEKDFLDFHDNFDINTPPDPADFVSHGNWSELAQKILIDRKHLSLVATMTRRQRLAFEAVGICSVTDLLSSDYKSEMSLDREVFQRLKYQAELQYKSENREKPLFEIKKEINLPPKRDEDLYFDMEGYPLYGKNGLEYLFGVTLASGEFIDFWAHNEEEEKKAFCDFIDLAIKNFEQNKLMKIYHYASYEVTAMRRLSTQYGIRENEVDTLLRNEVFIDLYKVVKDSLIIGTPNYSIKSVEKIYRPKRSTDVATAGDSVIAYAEWVASGESKDWRESEKLKNIRDYNKDDCDSTLELADWLRSLMVKPYSSTHKEAKEQASLETDISLIRQQLLLEHPNDPVFENLTYLMDFNKRKDKPMWWRYFDRYTLTIDELREDLSCISELKKVSATKNTITMSFDSAEETKIKPGDNCVNPEDISFKITDIDTKRGYLTAKVAAKSIDYIPEKTSLMIHNYFNTKSIDDRIVEFANHYHDKDKNYHAIFDFLNRSRPRLNSNKVPLVDDKKDRLDEAIKIVDLMDETTLCIQGPPGTGKTYTARKLISHIVRVKKQRVVIMSNSHMAIINLLNECMKEFPLEEEVYVAKVGDNNQEAITDARVNIIDSGERYQDFNIVGGTIHALCKASYQFFDYLFIDEAGQVALAHLVAGGMSARNIILMGDQQQLPQPVEGSHPLETGQSLLDYYLQGKATISDDQGIFLNKTYRMHHHIAHFISQSIYEGKLETHELNQKRVVRKRNSGDNEAGIVYVPVDHKNNSQASSEERKAIVELTKSLLGREKTNKDGVVVGEITLDDILFVAPYNLQVSLLSQDLRQEFSMDAKVGSVDKFQGQEESIVILSMCTSSEEDIGSRGVDFLFSLNRLNVALTRAQCLAFIVASPNLVNIRTNSISKMQNLNFWNWLISSQKII
jgi:predicted RecB family nuclease